MKKYKDIENYLNENEIGYAFESIREVLKYPRGIENNDELIIITNLMARYFSESGNEKLKLSCEAVTSSGADSDTLYQLGFDLVNAQYPDIASAILFYALKQFPKDLRLLYELTAALEMQGLYELALKNLKEFNAGTFLANYLLAFNTLMIGDIAESKKITENLQADSESSEYMLKRLHNIFERVSAVEGVTSLDKSDYRGWHFVLTGGLLLHLPDLEKHKFGQYEYLEDSESLCKEGIYRLSAIFDVWKMKIPQILSFDNPESQRLGLAFSEMLGIPEKKVTIPREPGLFVIYDHSNVIPEVLDLILKHEKGLQVYCHASQFTKEYKVAPDFTNLMYSSIVSPWNRYLIFPRRPELPILPSTKSDNELAKDIVNSELPQSGLKDLQNLLNLAEVSKPFAAGLMKEGILREKQWYGRKY